MQGMEAGLGTVRLRSVVLDCPDPTALAAFYSDLLGGSFHSGGPEWCEVFFHHTTLKLAFQRADRYVRPDWPRGVPQQLHLDLSVSNLAEASLLARSLGAIALGPLMEEPECVYMVHADPAGHPFCLCQDRPGIRARKDSR
jgi:predicted enzyme related to lactoylglutathione lyase